MSVSSYYTASYSTRQCHDIRSSLHLTSHTNVENTTVLPVSEVCYNVGRYTWQCHSLYSLSFPFPNVYLTSRVTFFIAFLSFLLRLF